MKNKRFIRVAVPSPLWQCFDYWPEAGQEVERYQPGMRVSAPFGRRDVIGVVVDQVEKAGFPEDKIKALHACLDETPLISESLLKLCHWMSQYYHHPLGEVIFTAMPKLLRIGRECSVDALETPPSEPTSKNLTLTEAQAEAVSTIDLDKGFSTHLLFGVTGSGKTEVYLQLIEKVLEKNKQVLVLVPEISLTPQTISRFSSRFSVPMVTLHSQLTDKQRKEAWLRARSGEARMVIGTRSAIFAVLPELGLIVLDEEHDGSFKQHSGLRYSARDVAVVRGKMENVPVVLGTATPALETLNNAMQKRYQLLDLPDRVGGARQPKVTWVDLCQKTLTAGLADETLDSIKEHLEAKGQVLLFINRRGFSPVMICHHCAWVVECEHCDARMTFHRRIHRCVCHHCGAEKPLPAHCPECKQTELTPVGVGTERLETVLKKHFPDNTVIRIDRDTTRRKGQLQDLLSQVHDQTADILVGTQMIAKGHHFSNLTLVVIVDADSGLFSVDFRALEHMGQLLVQVAGRSGREEKLGSVMIQTHQPENPLLKALLSEGYMAFGKALLDERRLVGLPPFYGIAFLYAESKEQEKAKQFLEQIQKQVEAKLPEPVRILGPVISPMPKKAGYYQMQLMIQSPQRVDLQKGLSHLQQALTQKRNLKGVRWSLDVDP